MEKREGGRDGSGREGREEGRDRGWRRGRGAEGEDENMYRRTDTYTM